MSMKYRYLSIIIYSVRVIRHIMSQWNKISSQHGFWRCFSMEISQGLHLWIDLFSQDLIIWFTTCWFNWLMLQFAGQKWFNRGGNKLKKIVFHIFAIYSSIYPSSCSTSCYFPLSFNWSYLSQNVGKITFVNVSQRPSTTRDFWTRTCSAQ